MDELAYVQAFPFTFSYNLPQDTLTLGISVVGGHLVNSAQSIGEPMTYAGMPNLEAALMRQARSAVTAMQDGHHEQGWEHITQLVKYRDAARDVLALSAKQRRLRMN